jgi:low temperature requirement protein LtrA
VLAERARRTPWHPGHIAERFGLFTIIVLGESILSAAFAVQAALDAGGSVGSLFAIAGGGLLTVFGMWWLYFAKPAHRFLTSNRRGFIWGYGHYLIFASAAAVGSGLAVTVDHAARHIVLDRTATGAAVTVPVAIYLLTTWWLHHHPHHVGGRRDLLSPAAALLVLAGTFTGMAVVTTGVVLAALVTVVVLTVPPIPLEH